MTHTWHFNKGEKTDKQLHFKVIIIIICNKATWKEKSAYISIFLSKYSSGFIIIIQAPFQQVNKTIIQVTSKFSNHKTLTYSGSHTNGP
jgi:hypothetical protein